LGVNATRTWLSSSASRAGTGFNGHPPLGVNATEFADYIIYRQNKFQWAPTLGGECYREVHNRFIQASTQSFNGHPPLGVNATRELWNTASWNA